MAHLSSRRGISSVLRALRGDRENYRNTDRRSTGNFLEALEAFLVLGEKVLLPLQQTQFLAPRRGERVCCKEDVLGWEKILVGGNMNVFLKK